MNKATFLLMSGLALISSLSISAQPARAKMQELKAQKQAFIQKESQLTDAEMKIWEGIQKANRPERRGNTSEANQPKPELDRLSQTSIEAMTETQAAAVLSERIARAEKAIALRKASIEAARQQLGAKKVLRIQLAEKQWRRELLKKIKEQRGEMPAQEDSDDLN
jgi:hypothetical protein